MTICTHLQILGVDRRANPAQIKKAYFRAALVCHPDKTGDPDATARFQQLSRAYSVLSDAKKRTIYDETGIVDDIDGECSGNAPDGSPWEDYFRAQFPAVTIERIEKFSEEYRSSEEERKSVLNAYVEYGGDMDEIVDNVMLASDKDRERFREMIDDAITKGEILGQKGGGKKQNKKNGDMKAKRRRERAEREAAEAEELLKELKKKTRINRIANAASDGDDNNLFNMIRVRNAERCDEFDSWASGIAARYSKLETQKKNKKKHKAKQKKHPATATEIS